MNLPILRRPAKLGPAAALLALCLLAACGSRPAARPTLAPATALPGAGVTLEAPTQPSLPTPAVVQVTAVPTDTPQPSATPEGLLGPVSYPANVNPLTGEIMADPTVLERVPLAIKVANSGDVRPQWGLSAADLVFEYFTEGGITRFTAIYLGHDASQVGSVRSARLIDLEIPNMYRAVLAYSGASVGVNEKMRAISFFDRILTPDFGRAAAFWRDADIPVPHNLFTSTQELRADAANFSDDLGRQDLKGMAFSETVPAGGQPGEQVTVSYNASYVLWFYQPGFGRYFRWNDGVKHNDAANGQQLSAANVIVLYANHVCDWSIVEDAHDPAGYWYSIEIQLWGTGPAKIFRDGQVYDVTWIRNRAEDMVGFVDADNHAVALKPGSTWFQLVAFDSPTTQDGADWDVDPKEPGCVKAAGT